MKSFPGRTCAVLTLTAIFCSCGGGGSGGGKKPVKIHGSGHLVDELRAVSDFTRVKHATEGALRVEQLIPATGDAPLTFLLLVSATDGPARIEEGYLGGSAAAGETLLVRAEDNLQPYLHSKVKDGVLELRTASNVDLVPTLPIEFFLTVSSLEGLTFQGVGRVDVLDLRADALALTCSGVGDVELSGLDAVELDAVVGGLCDVRASGRVDRQTVQTGGLGTYRAEQLRSGEAEVLVAGPHSATVRVCDLLVATIESSGSVFYYGSPTVEETIHGSGTVEQLDESCELLPPR